MTEEVARLQYRIEASTARFEANVKRAERLMTRSSKQIERSAGSVDARMAKLGARFGAVLGGLSAGVAIRGLDRMLTTLDNIGKTADRVGLTTEALQRLRSAAQQTGVDTRTLDMAMQRFSRRLAEARNGTGEARGVLEEMGIALTDATGRARSNEDVLNDVADAMSQVDNETDALRIAFKLFDSEGAALVNTLRDGSDELERMKAAARGVIADDEIRAAEALRTEIDLLRDALGNNFLQVVGKAAEALNSLFGIMTPTQQLAGLVNELREVQGGIAVRSGRDDARSQRVLRALQERESSLIERIRELNEIVNAPPPDDASGSSVTASIGATSGGARRAAPGTPFDDALASARDENAIAARRATIAAIADDEERLRLTRALEIEMMELALAERLRAEAVRQNTAAGRENTAVTWEQEQAIGEVTARAGDLARGMDEITAAQEAQRASAEQSRRAIEGIGDAFANGIARADSFGDALRNIGMELAALAIRGVFGMGPLGGAVNTALGTESGGVFGAMVASAKGNVFSHGNVVPFARGGIVNGPTMFPMAGARTGLMGEAGPEAIMPLKRGPGGKLGVVASGGGGTTINVDARGSTDPAAVEAAARRGAAMALAQVPGVTREQRRRGQL